MSGKIIRECETCGAVFATIPSRIALGWGRFCSHPCRKPPASLEARFRTKVLQDGPVPSHLPALGSCSVWTGYRDRYGYGRFGVSKGNVLLAHRVAWFISTGEWPTGMLLHACDNPACVRADHLFVGTQAENIADMDRKGRARRGSRRGSKKLTALAVLEIRRAAAAGEAHAAIASRLGVHPQTIGNVVTRRTFRAVP